MNSFLEALMPKKIMLLYMRQQQIITQGISSSGNRLMEQVMHIP